MTNIGGRARKVDMNLQELHEALDRQWDDGYQEGRKGALDELRDEIRIELEQEIERWDPNCPLCLAHKRLAKLSQDHELLRARHRELHARARGWAIRGR